MKAEIVTAYAYSAKSKAYIYAAYVLESHHAGLPNRDTFKVLCNYAIDDKKETARAESIARLYANNVRHPDKMPITDMGRLPFERVSAFAF